MATWADKLNLDLTGPDNHLQGIGDMEDAHLTNELIEDNTELNHCKSKYLNSPDLFNNVELEERNDLNTNSETKMCQVNRSIHKSQQSHMELVRKEDMNNLKAVGPTEPAHIGLGGTDTWLTSPIIAGLHLPNVNETAKIILNQNKPLDGHRAPFLPKNAYDHPSSASLPNFNGIREYFHQKFFHPTCDGITKIFKASSPPRENARVPKLRSTRKSQTFLNKSISARGLKNTFVVLKRLEPEEIFQAINKAPPYQSSSFKSVVPIDIFQETKRDRKSPMSSNKPVKACGLKDAFVVLKRLEPEEISETINGTTELMASSTQSPCSIRGNQDSREHDSSVPCASHVFVHRDRVIIENQCPHIRSSSKSIEPAKSLADLISSIKATNATWDSQN